MGFSLYRYESIEKLSETYEAPERVILSSPKGPIASYVGSVCKPEAKSTWDLSELELLALLRPGSDITHSALLFDSGSAQPGHITLYRLQTIHGESQDDTTEMVFQFRTILNNFSVPDVAAFRQKFSLPAGTDFPTLYESLKLSGGMRGGSWKWMEAEQILNATSLSSFRSR